MRSTNDYVAISIMIIMFGMLWLGTGITAGVMLWRDDRRAARWAVACLVFFVMLAMACSVPAGEA